MKKNLKNQKSATEAVCDDFSITIKKPDSFITDKCKISKEDPFRDRIFASAFMLEQLLDCFIDECLMEQDIADDLRFIMLDFLNSDSLISEESIDEFVDEGDIIDFDYDDDFLDNIY
ncbi:MAG: hypothetical protein NT007_16715 [Candidatus Kapabacteria bacterium]|nr:hypothetical protein [Candidatus Kapabacteria bacterium]